MMLAASINKGDSVPIKLTFEGADKKPFTVDVKAKAQENNSADHKH
jgi:copper(I)-binding protein